jgi:hypothetical protein
LSEFKAIEISSKVLEVTVKNKQENSPDFYLDFFQDFGLWIGSAWIRFGLAP